MRPLAGDRLVERDYARRPLTATELEQIFGADPIAPFLNTRHAVYKERDLARQLPPRAELIELIVAEPNLLRRPITRRGPDVIIGFEQAALQPLAAT